jgi:hypothetical protein
LIADLLFGRDPAVLEFSYVIMDICMRDRSLVTVVIVVAALASSHLPFYEELQFVKITLHTPLSKNILSHSC